MSSRGPIFVAPSLLALMAGAQPVLSRDERRGAPNGWSVGQASTSQRVNSRTARRLRGGKS